MRRSYLDVLPLSTGAALVMLFIFMIPPDAWAAEPCGKSGQQIQGECQAWCVSYFPDHSGEKYKGCFLGCPSHKLVIKDQFQCDNKVYYWSACSSQPPSSCCSRRGWDLIDDCQAWCSKYGNGNFQAGCYGGCNKYASILDTSGCRDKIWHVY